MPADFLGPFQPLPENGAPVMTAAGDALGGAATSNRLSFAMEVQEEDQWCWAAVAVSVARFFDPATGWTQCLLACAEFERSDCCDPAHRDDCDKPWYLNRALARTDNLAAPTHVGPRTFAEVAGEIDAGRPAGCRIEWRGGDEGHFVVIGGWLKAASGKEYVDVFDPKFGFDQIPYAELRDAYRFTGRWEHSYAVRPAAPGAA